MVVSGVTRYGGREEMESVEVSTQHFLEVWMRNSLWIWAEMDSKLWEHSKRNLGILFSLSGISWLTGSQCGYWLSCMLHLQSFLWISLN